MLPLLLHVMGRFLSLGMSFRANQSSIAQKPIILDGTLRKRFDSLTSVVPGFCAHTIQKASKTTDEQAPRSLPTDTQKTRTSLFCETIASTLSDCILTRLHRLGIAVRVLHSDQQSAITLGSAPNPTTHFP